MVAINLKLAPEREFEMKIARVVGKKLPWGYKKRFFVNLCRAVFSPDMSDAEARERVIKVVEEGHHAIAGLEIHDTRSPLVGVRPTDVTKTIGKSNTPPMSPNEPETDPPRKPPPNFGSMFRFD